MIFCAGASSVTAMRHGFTLVELAIVLVVIGLVIGGVFVGQDMIRAGQLQAVGSEYHRYVSAIQNFRAKYSAYPGDMKSATSFWGSATNCTATTGVALSGGTCNGNGTGVIVDAVANTIPEHFYAWHHLSNAGLVEGYFTGLTGSGHVYDDANAGTNVPQSKLGNSIGWCINRNSPYSGGWVFAVNYSNTLTIGNTSMAGAGACSHGTELNLGLLPSEAYDIDRKLDDGMPATGNIIASVITRCTNAWTATTMWDAIYSLTGTFASVRYCGLIFNNAF